MNRALALALVVAGCGRVGFEPANGDGGVLDDGMATPDACAAGAWSAAITRLANVSVDGVEDWEPTVTPDGLTIVFASYRAGVDSRLFISTRATIADDFPVPTLVPGLGAAGTDVIGPAWSIDGTRLYYSSNGPKVVDYLGGTQFGAPRDSGLPGDSVAFVTADEVFTTTGVPIDDYDLNHFTRAQGIWTEQPLPDAYNRSGDSLSDGWPTFDRARRELYFEHEEAGEGMIVRARLDANGALPASFERLRHLGVDLGDPELSADGLRMYVGSRRRADSDFDIYMFERSCDQD